MKISYGYCAKFKKPIALQFKEEGTNFFAVGCFLPMVGADGKAKDVTEDSLHGAFYLSEGYQRKGCPRCGAKYMFVCRDCGNFVCYNGMSGTAYCPGCDAHVSVPAMTTNRIVANAPQNPLTLPTTQVLVAIDYSGSMRDVVSGTQSKFDVVRQAVIATLLSDPNIKAQIGIVYFHDRNEYVVPMTTDRRKLIRVLQDPRAYPCNNTIGPFRDMMEQSAYLSFLQHTGKKIIILYTDGGFNDLVRMERLSQQLKTKYGVTIITIGSPDADSRYLAKLSSGGNSISAAYDNMEGAFADAISIHHDGQ